MIDTDGFRPNVGIILANDQGRLLWARRVTGDGWQFPQGGIAQGESPQQALYRELEEEVGLTAADVKLLARTSGWLRYHLPKRRQRKIRKSRCIGQKQIWFLLQLLVADSRLRLDAGTKPEFDGWRWVNYWYPLARVIPFKREVYRSALCELAQPFGKIGPATGRGTTLDTP